MEDSRWEERLKAQAQQAAHAVQVDRTEGLGQVTCESACDTASWPRDPLSELRSRHFTAAVTTERTARGIAFMEREPAFVEFLKLLREGIL